MSRYKSAIVLSDPRCRLVATGGYNSCLIHRDRSGMFRGEMMRIRQLIRLSLQNISVIPSLRPVQNCLRK